MWEIWPLWVFLFKMYFFAVCGMSSSHFCFYVTKQKCLLHKKNHFYVSTYVYVQLCNST